MRWLQRRRRRRKWREFYRAERYAVMLLDELTGDWRAAEGVVDVNGDLEIRPIGPKRLAVQTGEIRVPVEIGRHVIVAEATFTLADGPATLDAGDRLLLNELTS